MWESGHTFDWCGLPFSPCTVSECSFWFFPVRLCAFCSTCLLVRVESFLFPSSFGKGKRKNTERFLGISTSVCVRVCERARETRRCTSACQYAIFPWVDACEFLPPPEERVLFCLFSNPFRALREMDYSLSLCVRASALLSAYVVSVVAFLLFVLMPFEWLSLFELFFFWVALVHGMA